MIISDLENGKLGISLTSAEKEIFLRGFAEVLLAAIYGSLKLPEDQWNKVLGDLARTLNNPPKAADDL